MGTFPDNPPLILSQYLSNDGIGGGGDDAKINANGDYSVTPDIFYIQPTTGVIRLTQMIVMIRDTNGVSADEYGNLGSALTNGIQLRIQNNIGTIVDLTPGPMIKTNAEWARICFDAEIKTWGAGEEFVVARYRFSDSGVLIQLQADENERLEVVLNDDLSGLIGHYFLVQGYVRS